VLDAELVLEPVEDNSFLRGFYDDPRALAFRTQLFFLVNRLHEQRRVVRLLRRGRDVVADYVFQKDPLFARLNLEPDELALYEDVYALLEPQAARPDLLVLLRADADTLMQRVAGRARAFEQALAQEYMQRVVEAYESFAAAVGGVPVLEADARDDFEEVAEHVRTLVDSAA
jgi:deoxyguanosine kinase